MFKVSCDVDSDALSAYVQDRVEKLLLGELERHIEVVTKQAVGKFIDAKVNAAMDEHFSALINRASELMVSPLAIPDKDQRLLNAVLRDGKTLTAMAMELGVSSQLLRTRFFSAAKARNPQAYAHAEANRPSGAVNVQLEDLRSLADAFTSDTPRESDSKGD